MKRIQVRPGKSVVVSEALLEKAARVFRDSAYTREEVNRMVAAEPRGVTVYAGPPSNKLAKPSARATARRR